MKPCDLLNSGMLTRALKKENEGSATRIFQVSKLAAIVCCKINNNRKEVTKISRTSVRVAPEVVVLLDLLIQSPVSVLTTRVEQKPDESEALGSNADWYHVLMCLLIIFTLLCVSLVKNGCEALGH